MKKIVLLKVIENNKNYEDKFYVGKFTEKEIFYMQQFPKNFFERRDQLINIRIHNIKNIPDKFMSQSQKIQLNPFFQVWEDEDIKDDYCLEKEDIHPWFKEIENIKEYDKCIVLIKD